MEEKQFDKYGFVYTIECKKTGQYYIGSTTNLDKRVREHCTRGTSGRCFNMEKPELKNAKLYNYSNILDLRNKEKEEIKKHIKNNLCINKNIPNRKHNEYYKDNQEHILNMHKRKLTCECGAVVSARHMARHKKKAQKHISFINNKNNI